VNRSIRFVVEYRMKFSERSSPTVADRVRHSSNDLRDVLVCQLFDEWRTRRVEDLNTILAIYRISCQRGIQQCNCQCADFGDEYALCAGYEHDE